MRRIRTRTVIIAAAAASLLTASATPALAQADLPTVISNATAWIVGILVGLATLFLPTASPAAPPACSGSGCT